MLRKPEWTRVVMTLPDWARQVQASKKSCIRIEIDPDGFIPYWLGLLNVSTPDQYWLEVAYQCAKLDIQASIESTPYDPRVAGKHAEIHVLDKPKWALAKFAKGKGIHAATQGKEARGHYKRIRGRIPLSM